MEDIRYAHALERSFRGFQINGVLLDQNINIKQLGGSSKMAYAAFAKTVWEAVDEFVRLTSLQKGFCEFFFAFASKKFGADEQLTKLFFADALWLLTHDESEENKYLSIFFTKKGGLTSLSADREPGLAPALPLSPENRRNRRLPRLAERVLPQVRAAARLPGRARRLQVRQP